jgi:hypothetical protein
MESCIKCLFQCDNNIDDKGNGRVFCMVRKSWKLENDKCKHFTEHADLSKEIRSKYAFEIRSLENKSGLNSIINQNWKAMIITLIAAFIMFVFVVKFFDKYIF